MTADRVRIILWVKEPEMLEVAMVLVLDLYNAPGILTRTHVFRPNLIKFKSNKKYEHNTLAIKLDNHTKIKLKKKKLLSNYKDSDAEHCLFISVSAIWLLNFFVSCNSDLQRNQVVIHKILANTLTNSLLPTTAKGRRLFISLFTSHTVSSLTK